jgi:hypothetical protein
LQIPLSEEKQYLKALLSLPHRRQPKEKDWDCFARSFREVQKGGLPPSGESAQRAEGGLQTSHIVYDIFCLCHFICEVARC